MLYKRDSLDEWCKTISPTIDGPSRHVRNLNIQTGIVPLVFEPRPLDPYLNHFSALTQVVNLMLVDHRGKPHLDMVFQCFSAFKNSLTYMKIITSSFEFEEISLIAEFFPNLKTLSVWGPSLLRCTEKRPLLPPRKASFPRLKVLHLHLLALYPELDNNILVGLSQASMDLQVLTVTGSVADVTLVQKLLDCSAHSLTQLMTVPLELDLSRCEKIRFASYYSHIGPACSAIRTANIGSKTCCAPSHRPPSTQYVCPFGRRAFNWTRMKMICYRGTIGPLLTHCFATYSLVSGNRTRTRSGHSRWGLRNA
ncbi:hypothetical protein BJ322DRAFT_1070155, partial [Thelephora terrestris]